jgi:hypothetical protein
MQPGERAASARAESLLRWYLVGCVLALLPAAAFLNGRAGTPAWTAAGHVRLPTPASPRACPGMPPACSPSHNVLC